MVYRSRGRALPQSLLGAENWADLNEVERQNFNSRLDYIDEICVKSHLWLDSPGSFEDPADYLDEVEQDLFINLSSGQHQKVFSPWLVHSSWTFDTSPSALLTALAEKCVEALSTTEIGFDCDETEFRTWLETQAGCLRFLLDGFYDAKNFGEVVAHLIGMDISLCALLLGVSKQRMNPLFFN